ncbi:hypothetical protein [Neptunitalea lumnitzerae]|uniref:Uncharacterized protein n=1 Tax=Neptunitalea lumnitzerae TaxID=2965509 RepID=A0ABQ5MEI1_9FLAO|nr:hypothetical protein [Neptunitalea sp. Y10]GLB47794.1 hypothetical protein Y10_01620 [Neptunitalea sp. Y10]
MRYRKIRGHRKKWKRIDDWVESNKDLDINYLKTVQRSYCKIWVAPWYSIPITNSAVPQPNGVTKAKMLEGLLTIHDSWKQTLNELGQPYYLKIWLYEPRFFLSQVVCSIGDMQHFYNQTFYKPTINKAFPLVNYGKLADTLANFDWEHCWDEDFLTDSDLGSQDSWGMTTEEFASHKSWFTSELKKTHRLTRINTAYNNQINSYAFKKGDVYIGGIP